MNIKVLFACIPTPGNRYMVDLKDGLEAQGCIVLWDYKEFWKCENEYDIVHIHWPEFISYEWESYLTTSEPISDSLWERTIDQFVYWKKKSKIVFTYHNHLPHRRKDLDFKKLYKIVLMNSTAVVHFANFSIQLIKENFKELSQARHVVIPHQNYSKLPNDCTAIEAKKILGISTNAAVMLVFGTVYENEKKLINKAFSYVPHKRKVLVAPGWKLQRRNISYIRLREWIYNFECWFKSQLKRKILNKGFVPEEIVQYYLNAADFLFIPRNEELNSGNISLGYTFGRIIVGKNSENIGELLRENNNPTFKRNDDETLQLAIKKAFILKNNQHGIKNKHVALNNWQIEDISRRYIDLFETILLT